MGEIVETGKIDLDRPLGNAADWQDLLTAQQEEWKKVIPDACGLTPVKVARLAFTFFRKNRKIVQNCTAGSILGALMDSAELGWEIGSKRGHATIVPFKSEATLMPMYRGLAMTAFRSGMVLALEADVVYEGEEFVCEKGLVPILRHVPADDDPPISSAVCAYAIARIRGLDPVMSPFVRLRRRYIERIKKAAIAKVGASKTLWGNPEREPEMWRKTPIRYLSKTLPDDTMPDKVWDLWDREDRYQGTPEMSAEDLTSQGMKDLKDDVDRAVRGHAAEAPPAPAEDFTEVEPLEDGEVDFSDAEDMEFDFNE